MCPISRAYIQKAPLYIYTLHIVDILCMSSSHLFDMQSIPVHFIYIQSNPNILEYIYIHISHLYMYTLRIQDMRKHFFYIQSTSVHFVYIHSKTIVLCIYIYTKCTFIYILCVLKTCESSPSSQLLHLQSIFVHAVNIYSKRIVFGYMYTKCTFIHVYCAY